MLMLIIYWCYYLLLSVAKRGWEDEMLSPFAYNYINYYCYRYVVFMKVHQHSLSESIKNAYGKNLVYIF